MGTGQKFFNDFSELVWISIYAKSLKSLANLAETVQTDPGSGPSNVARGFPGPAPKGTESREPARGSLVRDWGPGGLAGCVLSVLASKIQTWSHMASASPPTILDDPGQYLRAGEG